MLLTLQALWILLFLFVGRTFLIKSSLSRMIHSIWIKTKFEVLDIPAKILAFCSCHTWYTVAAKLSLQEKLTKLLPYQVTVAHRIHSSQPFVIWAGFYTTTKINQCSLLAFELIGLITSIPHIAKGHEDVKLKGGVGVSLFYHSISGIYGIS
jgi:hypothetical protein